MEFLINIRRWFRSNATGTSIIVVNITIQNEKIQAFINEAMSKLEIKVVNIDANKKMSFNLKGMFLVFFFLF